MSRLNALNGSCINILQFRLYRKMDPDGTIVFRLDAHSTFSSLKNSPLITDMLRLTLSTKRPIVPADHILSYERPASR